MGDSASLSVSRGTAASQLYFRQEPFVLLHQHQVYELFQRLGTTKHLYHLGPPLQFLDQPFQLVGGVKVGPNSLGMVQELKRSVEAEEIPAAGGHQRDLLCAEEWIFLEDDAEGSPPLEDGLGGG